MQDEFEDVNFREVGGRCKHDELGDYAAAAAAGKKSLTARI